VQLQAARNDYPDIDQSCRTPVGTFTVYRERGLDCASNEFPVGKGGAPMPDCIFFHGGNAIHGASFVPKYNTSHGCIHVTMDDSEWLEKQMKPGTATVIVLPYDHDWVKLDDALDY
jgi:lipoprotein-anchoring transpeptidase ErfK/SrfK